MNFPYASKYIHKYLKEHKMNPDNSILVKFIGDQTLIAVRVVRFDSRRIHDPPYSPFLTIHIKRCIRTRTHTYAYKHFVEQFLDFLAPL